ncbi:MAG: hypothetical protein K0R63_451 [Rickettsiales bacterium]|jgi:uncharacterized membrane protein YeiH|nr:hypothetical protein [Rickettsiales bacterium]
MEELAQTQAMYLASLMGSIAFALSGFLAGLRKNLDWMGLFILAFLTANGGGVLRDVLTDRTPVILMSGQPFLIALAVTCVGSLFKFQRNTPIENRWLFIICDAIGLVAFAITGSLVAVDIHAPFFGFITLAFLTATGGAILRDILVNNIPEVLHGGFYGSVATLVAMAIYLLNMEEILTPIGVLSVFVGGLIIRLTAHHYRWKLPKP